MKYGVSGLIERSAVSLAGLNVSLDTLAEQWQQINVS